MKEKYLALIPIIITATVLGYLANEENKRSKEAEKELIAKTDEMFQKAMKEENERRLKAMEEIHRNGEEDLIKLRKEFDEEAKRIREKYKQHEAHLEKFQKEE